ncbi:hypothetical protein BDE40_0855 [Litoreibacter halocynthiae]|uniref:Outer membrane protein with beta-barrel domain n=2 Tax=Litoreibacter halocynthiae TaxID=1242689 RepID=A0A4R7LNE8_9RHOB|nr:hypothetical protein [Litoreibacter halocynthiae]TDT77567.1 hypothetical protein BDE40_0855 [Litoreibacter halocynthiae]
MKMNNTLRAVLIASTSMVWGGAVTAQEADFETSCALVNGVLPANCTQDNASEVVVVPAGENNELDRGNAAVGGDGFLISIDGKPVIGDKRVEDEIRKTDIALSNADVQVKFDGLGAVPRLDLVAVDQTEAFEAGDVVTFRSRTNYPAYLSRGEVRMVDIGNAAGPKTLAVVPVQPNGSVSVTIPEGRDVVAIHRVYDARGRYNETEPLSLQGSDDRGLFAQAEEGTDATRVRGIPVSGGAITVYGKGVRSGATVQTLGENVKPDADGSFVVQRILPAGERDVEVRISGAGEDIYLQRSVEIPRSEWFGVATVDLTFGYREDAGKNAAGGAVDKYYDRGRLAFYVKGKTQKGWNITASADTGEDELSEIFRNLDKKDPRHLLLRLDSEKAYPVYGDDSTIVEDAPTSGKFYFKAEREGNFALWGNYKGQVNGSHFLRNERTLYGFQGHVQTQATTSKGEPRAELDLYAAQPDTLPGRDVFRGTGGSVYFLQRQDLSIGSETIAIEIRDPDTGRVTSREVLVYGRDYDINYLQGVITLTRPLTGATGGGTVITDPLGENTVQLTVNYEFTPTAGTIDGYAYGGRAQFWATDNLRFGATGLVEQTDIADQTAYGADMRYEISDTTFLELEYARTEGPGFGSSYSSDGGLIVTNTNAVGGTGEAYMARGQVDLKDLNPDLNGQLGAYYEKRRAGFSTLDYQTTVDEELWGVYGEYAPTERLSYRLYYDDFTDDAGKVAREGGLEVTYKVSKRLTYDFGIEHIDKVTPAGAADETGKRTDVAVRATITVNPKLEYSVFGQATVSRSGGLARNHRVGAGVKYQFAQNWTFEGEISDGSRGVGALALLSYDNGKDGTAYFGYTLDPGRSYNGVDLSGKDRGQFVVGGTRRLSQAVDVYAENTYDLFGQHRSLTSTYGINYARSEFLRYSASVEVGRVDDSANGDFDRTALSFGVRYENQTGVTGTARLEYRRDRGVYNNTSRDGDTIALVSTLRYKIDEEQRLLFSFDGSYTDTDGSSIPDGRYAELTLGYAYRPIENDRLNVLLKYTYLHDLYGQEVDGTNDPGPRQKSHVLSLDASYDLNRNWTLGGKLGGRWSQSSPDATTAFQDNDAWLVVANARYHLTHKWDVLVEGRALRAEQAGVTEYGILGAAYRHIGNNYKVGVGYNFGKFSDDLTDLTYDDKGMFINLIAKF